jgi:murein DD-endopeptidase MepM/ murein hydrolase activator NlpD
MMATLLTLIACACSSPNAPADREDCNGYVNWQTSPYILPYAAGSAYQIIQGNCSPAGDGHRGVQRYSYDFGMGVGTVFTAAQEGTVVEIEQSHRDGEIGPTGLDNYITIRHDDGTFAIYGHITQNGARVALNQRVLAGVEIGLSGNTGNTGNVPHLHVAVHSCNPVSAGSAACPSLPMTFRNTSANANGLQRGVTYTALVF